MPLLSVVPTLFGMHFMFERLPQITLDNLAEVGYNDCVVNDNDLMEKI